MRPGMSRACNRACEAERLAASRHLEHAIVGRGEELGQRRAARRTPRGSAAAQPAGRLTATERRELDLRPAPARTPQRRMQPAARLVGHHEQHATLPLPELPSGLGSHSRLGRGGEARARAPARRPMEAYRPAECRRSRGANACPGRWRSRRRGSVRARTTASAAFGSPQRVSNSHGRPCDDVDGTDACPSRSAAAVALVPAEQQCDETLCGGRTQFDVDGAVSGERF
jgi:hypothetical protein